MFDQLLTETTQTLESDKRFELFQKAEDRLIEAMPFIPIYFYVRSLLIDRSVDGWYSNILDYHPYQFISLTEKD